jgi:hypothetical protein
MSGDDHNALEAEAAGSTTAAGNGNFGCRDEAPKIVIQTRGRPQRPKSGN